MSTTDEPTSPRTAREALAIDVGPQIAWHTLTEPAETERWLGRGARLDRAVGGIARVPSLSGAAFEGAIVEADSTRRLLARAASSPSDELDLQIARRGEGVTLRVARTRALAGNDAIERIASEAREWRFALLALRQYVEGHRRTDPVEALAAARTELAPDHAWRTLTGANGFTRAGSLDTLQRRDRVELDAAGERLAGRVVVHEALRQFVVRLENAGDALLRLEILRGERETVAIAMLRAFDVASSEMAARRERWLERFARLFPGSRVV